MATITKGKILWRRIKSAIGHLKLWWMASGAVDNPKMTTGELAAFQEGEQIPLKGLVFVVGKKVEGPIPVLLLTPVERTARAEKSAGARQTRNARLARKLLRRQREQQIKRARSSSF